MTADRPADLRHQQDRFGHCVMCGIWLQDMQEYVPAPWPCDAAAERERHIETLRLSAERDAWTRAERDAERERADGWKAQADEFANVHAGCPDALALERERADALAKAIDFDPYPGDPRNVKWHGGEVLRGITTFMDHYDDEKGVTNRTAQADLRVWADRIDQALAAYRASREGGV